MSNRRIHILKYWYLSSSWRYLNLYKNHGFIQNINHLQKLTWNVFEVQKHRNVGFVAEIVSTTNIEKWTYQVRKSERLTHNIYTIRVIFPIKFHVDNKMSYQNHVRAKVVIHYLLHTTSLHHNFILLFCAIWLAFYSVQNSGYAFF